MARVVAAVVVVSFSCGSLSKLSEFGWFDRLGVCLSDGRAWHILVLIYMINLDLLTKPPPHHSLYFWPGPSP